MKPETDEQYAMRHGYVVLSRRIGWCILGPRQKARSELGEAYPNQAEAWRMAAQRVRRAKKCGENDRLRRRRAHKAVSAARAASSR